MQHHRQQHQRDSWINKKALRSPTTGMPMCVKMPIAIDFQEKHLETPIELKQRIQDLEVAYKEASQHRENSENAMLTLVQRQTLHKMWIKLESVEWFEAFDLKQFPIEKMRVNWLPQERCLELNIQLNKRLHKQLQEFKELDFVGSMLMGKSLGAAYEGQLLLESLREGKQFAAANSEERMLKQKFEREECVYRKYIDLPKYICPSSLKVQFDLTKKVLLIKSSVHISEEKLEKRRELCAQQNKHNLVEAQSLLEKRFKHCTQGGHIDASCSGKSGCDQQVPKEHEDCHPKVLVVSILDLVEMGLNDARIVPDFLLKHIVDEEQPELFYASHEIRKIMRQQINQECSSLFHTMMRSPRFVQDCSSDSASAKDRKYRLRLECNLMPNLHKEKDVQVKLLDEKKRIIQVEVNADIRGCEEENKATSIAQQKMCFNFTLPEMVDVEGMQQEYCKDTGRFSLLLTVNKAKSAAWFEHLKKNQPKH